MLTHRMVMHCIAAQEHIAYQADGLVPCNKNDVILSWLPLSHIMERSDDTASPKPNSPAAALTESVWPQIC